MEPEGSLPHLQVPTTFPYPVPARSSPSPHILIRENCVSFKPIKFDLKFVAIYVAILTPKLYEIF